MDQGSKGLRCGSDPNILQLVAECGPVQQQDPCTLAPTTGAPVMAAPTTGAPIMATQAPVNVQQTQINNAPRRGYRASRRATDAESKFYRAAIQTWKSMQANK